MGHPELGRGSAVREATISLYMHFFIAEKRWVRAWTEHCSLFRGKARLEFDSAEVPPPQPEGSYFRRSPILENSSVSRI